MFNAYLDHCSTKIEGKGKAVFDKLLFPYLFFNHLYNLLLSLVHCFRLLLDFLLFLCFLNRNFWIGCFLLLYFLHLVAYLLLLHRLRLLRPLMNVDTYISLQALSFQEVLAKFSLVFVIFLHKVNISMILSTSSPQVAFSHLILLAHCLSLHERPAQLILCMSKGTRQSSAAVLAMRTRFSLIMSSFVAFDDPLSFDVPISCKQVIINKSPFKLMLIFCPWTIYRQ